jgi:hypothetical protein
MQYAQHNAHIAKYTLDQWMIMDDYVLGGKREHLIRTLQPMQVCNRHITLSLFLKTSFLTYGLLPDPLRPTQHLAFFMAVLI